MANTTPGMVARAVQVNNLNQVHPNVAAAVAQGLGRDNVKVQTAVPYWSRVRFIWERTGTSPNFVYTLRAGRKVRAFGYPIGGSMEAAGRPGESANAADTNIQTTAQTVGNDRLVIYGVAIQATGQNDPLLLQKSASDISVTMAFDGGKRNMVLGNLEMIPGAAGLYGSGTSAASATTVGQMTQGWPEFTNFEPYPEGIVWKNAGRTDGNLVVVLQVERDVVVTVSNANAPDPDAGVGGFIDLRIQFITENVSDVSQNQ